MIAAYENSSHDDTDIENDVNNPERIVAFSITKSGQPMFVIKWKHSKKLNLIPAKTVKFKWPQLVQKFHETNLKFKNTYK